MTHFRKKPDIVEAEQWSGSNWHQLLAFAGREHVSTDGHDLFLNGIPVEKNGWVVKEGSAIYAMNNEVFEQTYYLVEEPA